MSLNSDFREAPKIIFCLFIYDVFMKNLLSSHVSTVSDYNCIGTYYTLKTDTYYTLNTDTYYTLNTDTYAEYVYRYKIHTDL